jgi:hypothetical protein
VNGGCVPSAVEKPCGRSDLSLEPASWDEAAQSNKAE